MTAEKRFNPNEPHGVIYGDGYNRRFFQGGQHFMSDGSLWTSPAGAVPDSPVAVPTPDTPEFKDAVAAAVNAQLGDTVAKAVAEALKAAGVGAAPEQKPTTPATPETSGGANKRNLAG